MTSTTIADMLIDQVANSAPQFFTRSRGDAEHSLVLSAPPRLRVNEFLRERQRLADHDG